MSNFSQRLTSWAGSSALPWNRKGRQSEAEGERHLEAGKYAEAEGCLASAVAEADQRRESGERRIRLRLNLTEAQRGLGKLAEAEQNARAALEHAVQTNDPEVQTLCLNVLGEVLLERGSFAAAETIFLEIIKIESERRQPDPSMMAGAVRQLGIARHKNGRFEEAVADLEKAVSLHEKAFGQEAFETGNLLGELGAIYRANHKNPEAQRCLSRALRIHERMCGLQSPEVMQDLRELAESLTESGDAAAAAVYCERMLKTKEQSLGGDIGELSAMQLAIGKQYVDWGNYGRARELLTQAMGTFRRTKGPSLAIALETLAYVDERSGHPEPAFENLKQAAAIWESCGPERTQELVTNANRRTALIERFRGNEQPATSIWREDANREDTKVVTG